MPIPVETTGRQPSIFVKFLATDCGYYYLNSTKTALYFDDDLYLIEPDPRRLHLAFYCRSQL